MVVGLVGESGGRLAGVSCVGIDEENHGDRKSGGYMFEEKYQRLA